MAVVYRHRRLDTNEIFYVGIGEDLKRPYNKSGRTEYWKRIVNKHGYKVEIIVENIEWEKAKEFEKSLIFLYGRKDLGKGPLINMTDGGEGALGRVYKPTKETIAKIQESRKGYVCSEETRKKMSETNKRIGNIPPRSDRPIVQMDMDGNIIKFFESALTASRELNIDSSAISKVCRGKRRHAGNFRWMYKGEESKIKLKIKNESYPKGIKRPVVQLSLSGDILKVFESATQAFEETGINISCISAVCNGRRNRTGNFRWKYKDEINN